MSKAVEENLLSAVQEISEAAYELNCSGAISALELREIYSEARRLSEQAENLLNRISRKENQ